MVAFDFPGALRSISLAQQRCARLLWRNVVALGFPGATKLQLLDRPRGRSPGILGPGVFLYILFFSYDYRPKRESSNIVQPSSIMTLHSVRVGVWSIASLARPLASPLNSRYTCSTTTSKTLGRCLNDSSKVRHCSYIDCKWTALHAQIPCNCFATNILSTRNRNRSASTPLAWLIARSIPVYSATLFVTSPQYSAYLPATSPYALTMTPHDPSRVSALGSVHDAPSLL